MTLPAPVESVVKEGVKYAGVALVVLGALPAAAQALGWIHIVVPSSILAYAAVASGVLGGLLRFAKNHGVTPTSVVAAVAHKVR